MPALSSMAIRRLPSIASRCQQPPRGTRAQHHDAALYDVPAEAVGEVARNAPLSASSGERGGSADALTTAVACYDEKRRRCLEFGELCKRSRRWKETWETEARNFNGWTANSTLRITRRVSTPRTSRTRWTSTAVGSTRGRCVSEMKHRTGIWRSTRMGRGSVLGHRHQAGSRNRTNPGRTCPYARRTLGSESSQLSSLHSKELAVSVKQFGERVSFWGQSRFANTSGRSAAPGASNEAIDGELPACAPRPRRSLLLPRRRRREASRWAIVRAAPVGLQG